jgi:Polyketide cyclase / dehydrase and lipid transport
MTITVRAEARIARPVDVVFALAAGRTANLARFFTGHKPLIPAIRSATLVGQEDPPSAGCLRDVALTDGTSIQERVLAFEAPRLHRYDMAKMNPLQRVLCSNMVSEWRFEPDGEGASRVVWEYSIHERGVLGRLLGPMVARHFQRAMQSCLDNIAVAALAG